MASNPALLQKDDNKTESTGIADGDAQPHLAIVVTSGLITTFYRGQVAWLKEAGFRVTFICSPGPDTAAMTAEGAEVIPVAVKREIAPFHDLRSLWTLWRTLRKLKPDITNVGAPKAGLVGGMAAWLARVPRRVYTIHGLRLETVNGWKRLLLAITERIACASAQYVRCVGPSLRDRAIALGITRPEKTYVLGGGSSNGLDFERFRRTPERVSAARELRHQLGIPDTSPVIGFVGRVVRDKGIHELWGAYTRLKQSFPSLHLLIVGDFEQGDPVDPEIRGWLQRDPHVRVTGMVPDTSSYYFLMDILALPTYREGFPNVPREASAAGVPTVTTTATGAVDAVVDRVTGLLVPPRDEIALATALECLLRNPAECRRMGSAGEEWVCARFRQEMVWEALVADYFNIYGAGEKTRRSSTLDSLPSEVPRA